MTQRITKRRPRSSRRLATKNKVTQHFAFIAELRRLGVDLSGSSSSYALCNPFEMRGQQEYGSTERAGVQQAWRL